MDRITLFLEKLQLVKRAGTSRHGTPQYKALCPAHKDRTPSLSITTDPLGNVLFNCFSHRCEFGDIIAALNMRASDCFADSKLSSKRYQANQRVFEIDAELETLQSRYGFSETTAKALIRVGILRSGRTSNE